MRIGEFLVQKKVIREADIGLILKHGEKTGLRFGDAALDMGLLKKEQLISVFGPDYRTDFFHLDPACFPQVTREWFSAEELVRWGILPLGLGTRHRFGFLRETQFNLGMLSPSRTESVEFVRQKTKGKSEGLKTYLILFDEYLQILDSVYGWDAHRIRLLAVDSIDPTLALFLGVE